MDRERDAFVGTGGSPTLTLRRESILSRRRQSAVRIESSQAHRGELDCARDPKPTKGSPYSKACTLLREPPFLSWPPICFEVDLASRGHEAKHSTNRRRIQGESRSSFVNPPLVRDRTGCEPIMASRVMFRNGSLEFGGSDSNFFDVVGLD